MSNSTCSSTKFKVARKKAVCFYADTASTTTSICSQLKPYDNNRCTEILMESQFSARVRASRNNGFIQTVIDCYNNHHNLVIRPDDVWTAILTQFSFFINKNAEEFRSKFVNFDGKKELVVKIDGTLRSAPYDLFVTQMTAKIDENLVDKTVKDWILPNFSTTTSNDIISCGIIFMATTKKYFDFTCELRCGIPYVTIEGTLADWEAISNRLEQLKDYKLYEWYEMLKPILKEFVAVKMGKTNIEFWNRICHHLSEGSGPTFLSGWLTAFAAFDEEGNWSLDYVHMSDLFHSLGDENKDVEPSPVSVIDIEKIPSGIVTVDVKIIERNLSHQSIMFAGHVGYEVLPDNCTLRPQIGWGVALKPTIKEGELKKFHESKLHESTIFQKVISGVVKGAFIFEVVRD